MVDASPASELREGEAAREGSGAAAIAVTNSPASEMDGGADARGGTVLCLGEDARGDLTEAANNPPGLEFNDDPPGTEFDDDPPGLNPPGLEFDNNPPGLERDNDPPGLEFDDDPPCLDSNDGAITESELADSAEVVRAPHTVQPSKGGATSGGPPITEKTIGAPPPPV